MNFTLQDLQQLQPNKRNNEEQAQADRQAYLQGKQGYPTDSPESLSESFSERYMGCYMMGYNTAEWENNNVD